MEVRIKITRNDKPIQSGGWTEKALAEYLERYINCYGFHQAEMQRDFPEYDISDFEFIKE
jgi:hypothetical protein